MYQSLPYSPLNHGGYGDLPGGFLTANKYPENPFYRQTQNNPYLYTAGLNRIPFAREDGDVQLTTPEIYPVNVLNDPEQYGVSNNIRDILGGNNRSGFHPQTFNAVQDASGIKAPFSPDDNLIQNIIQKLQSANNQGFIKTPPINSEFHYQGAR